MTDQARTYNPVPPQVDLTAMEHQILDLWSEQDTFAASLRQTEAGPRWTFFEGPPTANGMPGIHHIEARVFKDIFPRFMCCPLPVLLGLAAVLPAAPG